MDSPAPLQRWYGKVLGVVVGIVLLRGNPLLGALLGLLIGHAFDADWFAGRRRHNADETDRDDPYRVLGLTADASDAEIDRAWRRLISRHHPDRATGTRQQAEPDAGAINAAYDRIQAMRKRS